MLIKDAIIKAANGQSTFQLISAQGELYQGPWDHHLEHFKTYAQQPVLWPLHNQPESVSALLQALVAGVIPVILPPDLPAAKLLKLREQYPQFGFYSSAEWIEPQCRVAESESVFFCLLTSGSTGHPKVIATSEANVSRGAAAIQQAQGLEECTGTAVTLPLAYSYAFVNQLLWTLINEKTLLLTPGLTFPTETFDLIHRHPVDMLCLVAQQTKNLFVAEISSTLQSPQIKKINFAGSPFPSNEFARLRELFPHADFYNNYGCTEAMPRLSIRHIQELEVDLSNVGKPIGDIELRIVDSENHVLPEQEVGAIQFRGSSISTGILNAQGELQPHPEWIGSGDHGFLNQGQLHVLGRHDQVVKVGGERFSLVEIENALLKQGLQHAYVCKSPSQQNGSQEDGLVAVIHSVEKPALRPLMRQLHTLLSAGAMPRKLYWIDHWPLLSNQKTDRERLKQLLQQGKLEQLS